jgi:hypothetical protein
LVLERIVNGQVRSGGQYYKVRWKGYGPEEESWHHVRELPGHSEAISQYEREKAGMPPAPSMSRTSTLSPSPASNPALIASHTPPQGFFSAHATPQIEAQAPTHTPTPTAKSLPIVAPIQRPTPAVAAPVAIPAPQPRPTPRPAARSNNPSIDPSKASAIQRARAEMLLLPRERIEQAIAKAKTQRNTHSVLYREVEHRLQLAATSLEERVRILRLMQKRLGVLDDPPPTLPLPPSSVSIVSIVSRRTSPSGAIEYEAKTKDGRAQWVCPFPTLLSVHLGIFPYSPSPPTPLTR